MLTRLRCLAPLLLTPANLCLTLLLLSQVIVLLCCRVRRLCVCVCVSTSVFVAALYVRDVC